MIDLHSHALPGLDDGARDLGEAIAMVAAMAADGVAIVCGTPHVRDDYPTSPEAMEGALMLLRAGVADAGIELDVRGGAEIAFDQLALLNADGRGRFGLGGNPALLLVETPYTTWPTDMARACARLRQDGIVPLIAHPERNPHVQDEPSLVEDLVRAGAVVQLTAASVDGRLGRSAAACSRRLLELELAHCIASDAHGPGVRGAGLSNAVAAVGGGELGVWLVSAVPAALLEGTDLPPRPVGGRKRRRWGH